MQATKIVEELPFEWNKPLYPAGICVYPSRIKDVLVNLKRLKKSNVIKIASGKKINFFF